VFASKRYVGAVKNYNLAVREFPSNIISNIMDFTTKPNFNVANEKETSAPPKVDFNLNP